jgi:hypothetical protein
MSAQGQKETSRAVHTVSALPLKAELIGRLSMSALGHEATLGHGSFQLHHSMQGVMRAAFARACETALVRAARAADRNVLAAMGFSDRSYLVGGRAAWNQRSEALSSFRTSNIGPASVGAFWWGRGHAARPS